MKKTSQRSLLFRQNVNRTEADRVGDRPRETRAFRDFNPLSDIGIG